MNAIHQVHLNTLLSEAEVCCATLYPKLSSFFRAPPVAAGRGGGGEATAAKWNGKSTASATSTCDAYNLSRDHQARHLLPDGTCTDATSGSRTRGLRVSAWALTLALSALTPTAAMPRSSPGSSEGAGLAAVAELRARVFSTNACDAIPG